MDDSFISGRRQLLTGVGVAGLALVAGCTEQLDRATGGQGDGSTNDGSVAAVAAVDEGAMQEAQMEIQASVSEGNMSEEEAQEEMATIQQEHIDEAFSALTEAIDGTDGASVGEEFDAAGAVAIEGDADAVLNVLQSDAVSALVPTEDIEA